MNQTGTNMEPIWNQTGTNSEPNWNKFNTKLEPMNNFGRVVYIMNYTWLLLNIGYKNIFLQS